MTDKIKKQVEFIDWMKSKKIYNPNYTAIQMQLMQTVWKEAGEGKSQKMWDELKNELALRYPVGKSKLFDDTIIKVIKSINQIEEKHNE